MYIECILYYVYAIEFTTNLLGFLKPLWEFFWEEGLFYKKTNKERIWVKRVDIWSEESGSFNLKWKRLLLLTSLFFPLAVERN